MVSCRRARRHSPGEVPRRQPLRLRTLTPRPLSTVCQGTQVDIVPNGNDDENSCNLQANPRLQVGRDEIEDTAGKENSEIECGEVVVQEELAAHYEERNVMQGPADEEEATYSIVFLDTC